MKLHLNCTSKLIDYLSKKKAIDNDEYVILD